MRLSRRAFIKLAGAALLAPAMFPRLLLASPGAIPVLLYHDISDQSHDDYTISPARFASQMEWLFANGYTAISCHELDGADARDAKQVIITFDDGYASFMDYAFPLLEGYRFKASINVIGRYVNSYLHLYGNRPLLSWDEYRFLLKSGLVELGCHTYNLHVRGGVAAFTGDELARDLDLFQTTLVKETGAATDVLAWPYGIYTEASIAIARQAGFRYLLTSHEGVLRGDYPLTAIPRQAINNKLDVVSFQQYLGEQP
jgi:peptidoglycan/xylan/chitin deacetylase (PgdA/CDA1 family)